MSNRPPVLSDDVCEGVAALVRSGRFASADDVVSEGLALIERGAAIAEDDKLEALRATVQLGLDDLERGDYREFDSVEAIRAYVRSIPCTAGPSVGK